MNKLTIDFYNRKNVVLIAKELLGKIIVTVERGIETSGRIVETEAYIGITDRASHAYQGKRTSRNEYMYAQAATSYVYICYGIHQMFNVVTNQKEIPDAVLVRAVEPLVGIDVMIDRTGKKATDRTLTSGPGNVAKALGISKKQSGANLLGENIYIAADGFILAEQLIGASPRIGVNYAGTDAMLPYRFYIRGNKYVSGRPVT